MLDISRALRDEQVLRSLTGLTVKPFEELLWKFDTELHCRRLVAQPVRKGAMGGGRKHTLKDSAGMLFFILLYLRIYPTMAVAGFLFGVARSRICDWVHPYQPVWEAVLGKSCDLPKRPIRSMDEFLLAFPKVRRVVIDATERLRTRPKDPELRRMTYSGKKKRHTSKNAIVADPRRNKSLVPGPHCSRFCSRQTGFNRHRHRSQYCGLYPYRSRLGLQRPGRGV